MNYHEKVEKKSFTTDTLKSDLSNNRAKNIVFPCLVHELYNKVEVINKM